LLVPEDRGMKGLLRIGDDARRAYPTLEVAAYGVEGEWR